MMTAYRFTQVATLLFLSFTLLLAGNFASPEEPYNLTEAVLEKYVVVNNQLTDPRQRYIFDEALSFYSHLLDFEYEYANSPDALQVRPMAEFPKWNYKRSVLGHVFSDRSTIILREDSSLSNHAQYYVDLHETGHMLGLDHNPDPHSVMYWALLDDDEEDVNDRFSTSDRKVLREIYPSASTATENCWYIKHAFLTTRLTPLPHFTLFQKPHQLNTGHSTQMRVHLD